jgi:putative FmdB family regulatory protein
MPLFEFTCSKGGKNFEELLALADLESAEVACPHCASTEVIRALSSFATGGGGAAGGGGCGSGCGGGRGFS